ncbi:MAG TPA: alpha/beta fold hydrolase [Vicinamibacterales bacterium]|nr:alpha/beta fold hydrolase [Vicinamibacterales bacterium]
MTHGLEAVDVDLPVTRISWHGHEVAFHRCGDGDAVILIHGIASSFDTWNAVLPELGKEVDALAPDLLGHGRSSKPRGDYSLGAFATGIRDLMEGLEIPSATIVGHSMGGGIAMQFAYQFPERCRRLVLVSSGGLGPEVTPLLKAATLPGSELFLKLATSDRAENAGRAVGSRLRELGFTATPSMRSVGRHFIALKNREARKAFVTTARSVMDWRGQRIDARDRLYLAAEVPTLIVWGRRDRFIPVAHGIHAHESIANSRLEIFDDSGHFPHEHEPARFAELLLDFIRTTEPAQLSLDVLRAKAFASSGESAGL